MARESALWPLANGGRRLDFAPDVTILPANSGLAISRGAFFGASDAPSREGRSVMAKAASLKIKLLSTADTGYFYVTSKNARTKTEKLTFKKYDSRRAQARRVQG